MISLRHLLFLTLAALQPLASWAADAPASTQVEAKRGTVTRIEISNVEEASAADAKLEAILTKLDQVASKAAPPAAVATATATPLSPADHELLSVLQKNINYLWVIISAVLVFNMQAGFCMLEIGFSRAKNTINIIMKSFLDICVCAVAYLFIGFAIQFGTSWNGIFGTDTFWLSSFGGDHPIWIFWFFQVGFAGVACTIVSGAIAERTKFLGYLIYCFIFSAFIYPLTGHWAWGGSGTLWGSGSSQGWLQAMGFIDYAGSSVVHTVGGACALAGIIVIGQRIGRFDKNGEPRLIAGHNMPLAALGTFLLWFGWFGFNAGSSLVGDGTIGRLAVNTMIAPSSGAIAAMLSLWFVQGRPDIGIAMNGGLGGAVAITACCGNISPAAGFVVGIFAGLFTTFATISLERMKLDDAVGAVPVHLINGWWGTLCVALFDEKGFDIGRLGVQALGTVCISGTSFILCFGLFKAINLVVPLRATDDEQTDGLDFAEHSANAYPDFQTSEQI